MKNMLTKKGIKIMINELDYWTQRALETADACEVKISKKDAKEIAEKMLEDDYIQQTIDDHMAELVYKKENK